MAVKDAKKAGIPVDPEKTGNSDKADKKRNGQSRIGWVLFWYGVPIFVSFLIIFGTIYYSMLEYNRDIEKMESVAEPVSELALNFKAVEDSVFQQQPEAPVSNDTLLAETIPVDSTLLDSDHFQMLQQEKLYTQIFTLKDRVLAQQNKIVELALSIKEKDKDLAELNEIKEKYEEQLKEIDYLKTSLPDAIIKKVKDDFIPKKNLAANGKTSGSQPETSGAGSGNGRKLAKIYGSMRPEEAAPILEKLGDEQIIEILLGMQQRQAAKILTKIDQSVAARISHKISIG